MDLDFAIFEDLANIVSIDANVTGQSVIAAVDETVELLNLEWQKITAITKEGATVDT